MSLSADKKDAALFRSMLGVAEANGFDSLTDAIARAVTAEARVKALTEMLARGYPGLMAQIDDLQEALTEAGACLWIPTAEQIDAKSYGRIVKAREMVGAVREAAALLQGGKG